MQHQVGPRRIRHRVRVHVHDALRHAPPQPEDVLGFDERDAHLGAGGRREEREGEMGGREERGKGGRREKGLKWEEGRLEEGGREGKMKWKERKRREKEEGRRRRIEIN